MAKITANYEVVYVLDPAQGEEAIAAQVANFKSLAEQNGSDVVVEEWGNRKLAYPINYKTAVSYTHLDVYKRQGVRGGQSRLRRGGDGDLFPGQRPRRPQRHRGGGGAGRGPGHR